MHKGDRQFPDTSDILARKARGRRERAALSFGEKLDILDALRQRYAPILEARRAQRQIPKTDEAG